MKYRVIILPGAESDIASAADWIAEHSPFAAARWLEGIRRAISTLSEMPSRCPIAVDRLGGEVVVGQLLYGRRHNRYRILFTVKGDTVHILRVRHGARAHPPLTNVLAAVGARLDLGQAAKSCVFSTAQGPRCAADQLWQLRVIPGSRSRSLVGPC